MKKKKIIYVMTILVFSLMIVLSVLNKKKTIMHDGMMLALSLDGESISSFPEKGEYCVSVACSNAKGKWISDEWKLALEDITGNVSCSLDFTSNPSTLRSEVEAKATINTNGYRYSGTNPDNYVWFNNEMWRIIGSIPTCTSSGCATSENLVKIIRKNSIGGIIFHPDDESNTKWGANTLYTLLNNYYWGAQDGTGTEYCYGYENAIYAKCDYTTIGINETSYYGKMVKNVYWNTGGNGGTQTVPGTHYAQEIENQTVAGYIGLMNISDFGYAADQEYHSQIIDSVAAPTNWLERFEDAWVGSGSAQLVSDGEITSTKSYYGGDVVPVVYLDSNTYIVSGTGSESDPYIIGL